MHLTYLHGSCSHLACLSAALQPLQVSLACFKVFWCFVVSQSPLDASIWLPKPSIVSMTCFVSPAPRYVSVLSPQLILAISGLFDTFRASIHPLKSSTRPLNLSMWPSETSTPLLGWCMSSACQHTRSRHTCGISLLPGLSNSMDTVTSMSGLFWGCASFWGIDCLLELCVQMFAVTLTLSPLSGNLCHLGECLLGLGCPFESCTLKFVHLIGWGMCWVDLCWCFTVFLGHFRKDGDILDVLSANWGLVKPLHHLSSLMHGALLLSSALDHWGNPRTKTLRPHTLSLWGGREVVTQSYWGQRPKESLNGEPLGAGFQTIYTKVHKDCVRLSIGLCTVHDIIVELGARPYDIKVAACTARGTGLDYCG